MTKSKKPKTKKVDAEEEVKKEKESKVKKIEELIIEGKITKNKKTDVPDINEISIISPEFEVEIELPVSLIALMEKKSDIELKEGIEIYCKLSKSAIKEDDAIYLARYIIHEVGKNFFVGSAGGLSFKLINLSDNIRLFTQNIEINIGLFKSRP
ncbi:MAG: hypothetical protein ACTSO9_08645 [Candidatus Helarchaeota archaeon]